MGHRKGKGQVQGVAPASFVRRAIAFLIDWYVGALATALPVAYIAMELGKDMADQDILSYPAPSGLTAGALGILFGIAYYALVPMFQNGQTLGKRVMGVRVAALDGSSASPLRLLGRQVLGLMVVEGAAVGTSTVIWQMASLLTGGDIVVPAMAVGTALTLASLVICALNPKRRAIHDLLFGTMVVPAKGSGV